MLASSVEASRLVRVVIIGGLRGMPVMKRPASAMLGEMESEDETQTAPLICALCDSQWKSVHPAFPQLTLEWGAHKILPHGDYDWTVPKGLLCGLCVKTKFKHFHNKSIAAILKDKKLHAEFKAKREAWVEQVRLFNPSRGPLTMP